MTERDNIDLVNITRGGNATFAKPNSRYMVINNVALDGFFIGSGKTTTINLVCSRLISERGWTDVGKLGGSNFRLLQYQKEKEAHFCLVCDDAFATCSLPDNINLTIQDTGAFFKTFTNHNTQNFLEMLTPIRHPSNNVISIICAKINSQNILNAAYGQLINSAINELITRYINTFSTNYNNPTNIILLYSREINCAQIQFTLADVMYKVRRTKLVAEDLLKRIDETIIDKPFNYGKIQNYLIIYYDECHAFYTRGLANRTDYAKLCYQNIHKRNRQFETYHYNSFDIFQSFFNFYQDETKNTEKILKTIYDSRNYRDEYINSWSHDQQDERNSLSFQETVEKIVEKVTNEICLLCRQN